MKYVVSIFLLVCAVVFAGTAFLLFGTKYSEADYILLALSNCDELFKLSETPNNCDVTYIDDALFGYDVVVQNEDGTRCALTNGSARQLKFDHHNCTFPK